MTFEDVLDQTRQVLQTGAFDSSAQAEQIWRSFLSAGASTRDTALATGALAEVIAMQGRMGEAEELFAKAAQGVTAPSDRLRVLCPWANIVVDGRRLNQAGVLGMEIAAELGIGGPSVSGIAPWGFVALSKLNILLGYQEMALTFAKRAVESAEEASCGKAEALSALAAVLELSGDVAGAMATIEDAMAEMSAGHALMWARADHGRLALATGDVHTAAVSLSKAVSFPDWHDRRSLAKVARVIAELVKVDPAEGAKLLERIAVFLESSTPAAGR